MFDVQKTIESFQLVQYNQDNQSFVCICAPKVGLVLSYDQGILNDFAKSMNLMNHISLTGMVGCRYVSLHQGQFYWGIKLDLVSLSNLMTVSFSPNLIKVTGVLCLAMIIQGALIAPAFAGPAPPPPAPFGAPAPPAPVALTDSGGGGGNDGVSGNDQIARRSAGSATVINASVNGSSGFMKAKAVDNSLGHVSTYTIDPGKFEIVNHNIEGNLYKGVNVDKISAGDTMSIAVTEGIFVDIEVSDQLAEEMGQYKSLLNTVGADSPETVALKESLTDKIMAQTVNTLGLDQGNQLVVDGNNISIRGEMPNTDTIASNGLEFQEDSLF